MYKLGVGHDYRNWGYFNSKSRASSFTLIRILPSLNDYRITWKKYYTVEEGSRNTPIFFGNLLPTLSPQHNVLKMWPNILPSDAITLVQPFQFVFANGVKSDKLTRPHPNCLPNHSLHSGEITLLRIEVVELQN